MENTVELTQSEINFIAERLDDILWDNFASTVEATINERSCGWFLQGEISDDDILKIKERLILIL